MKQKVERITNRLVETFQKWPCAEAITLADSAEFDIYDPYFFLSLDIYCRGEIPGVEERFSCYEGAAAFETSSKTDKDRFLLEGLPVRIEFKRIEKIEEIFSCLEEKGCPYLQGGTYMFYRMEVGRVLWERSGWISAVKEALHHLPESFWRSLYRMNTASLEHKLSDLGAAVWKNDPFFYLINLSEFVKIFSVLLFILNKKFEPSGRRIFDTIFNLPLVPENFVGRYESLISEDPEITPSRRRELAELLTKSIINLGSGVFKT